MKIFVSLTGLLLVLGGLFYLGNTGGQVEVLEKINGVSLVNPRVRVDSLQMSGVKRVNGSWVAVIPYGFSREGVPEVHFDTGHHWWGERVEGTAELIRLAHQCGLKVMLKPHVWQRGAWIGDFDLETEEEWDVWEGQYRAYILTFAKLAKEVGVELFCIGTEYKRAVQKRPAFWRELIAEVREVYQGPLTYAANWDNYERVPFWEELDYIGIDAYFPLVYTADPTLEEIKAAWKPLLADMQAFGAKYSKPILFAEYGYQSVNGAAGNHWEVQQATGAINMELQARAYEALYRVFWKEPWFAGGFFWKWHFDEKAGGPENYSFTPQGKPAEKIIGRWYGGKPASGLTQ